MFLAKHYRKAEISLWNLGRYIDHSSGKYAHAGLRLRGKQQFSSMHAKTSKSICCAFLSRTVHLVVLTENLFLMSQAEVTRLGCSKMLHGFHLLRWHTTQPLHT